MSRFGERNGILLARLPGDANDGTPSPHMKLLVVT